MQTVTTLSPRGTITIPADLRKAAGLSANQQLLLEMNEEGEICLKPAMVLPLETYSEKRIAEFTADDAALADFIKP